MSVTIDRPHTRQHSAASSRDKSCSAPRWLMLGLIALLLIGCERSEDERPRVERLYFQSCTSCHERGLANAPRRGDQTRWQELIDDKGMDTLVRHTVEGYRAMPPRGQCFDCEQEDFVELIQFMKSGAAE